MSQDRTRQTHIVSFGIVLYYFNDPGTIRESLLNVLGRFGECYHGGFSRISETGDRFKAFRESGRLNLFLAQQINNHDFSRSLFFSLTNASISKPPTHRMLFWGRRIDPAFKSKTPNYIYFELPPETDLKLCWHLFRESFFAHDFHLGLGNYVLVTDDESMPRSGANAVKQLCKSESFILEFDASFRNLSYLKLLESRSSKFLAQPSQFIAVGRELQATIDFAEALSASGKNQANFEFWPSDEAFFFKANETVELVSMSRFISSHFGHVDKPAMFWKQEEWNTWVNRLRGEMPGKLYV